MHSTRALAILTLFGLLAGPLASGEGDLDDSFWSDGRVAFDPLAINQQIEDVVVAPDGRLVVVGFRDLYGESTLFWQAFGDSTAGILCSPVAPGGGISAHPHAAAFDSAGRLLIAGTANFPTFGDEAMILRYLYPNCTLDTSFNGDGVYVSLYAESALFSDLDLDSQGRIVAVGYSSGSALVTRLAANGLFDWSFDADGHLELDLGPVVSVNAVEVQPNDRIVLAGSIIYASSSHFLVVRLDPAGALDPDFSDNGVLEIDIGQFESVRDLAIDGSSGDILLAGKSRASLADSNSSAVIRLLSNGDPDDSFDGDGKWVDRAFDEEGLETIELQSDGKLVLAGYGYDNGFFSEMLVYRLLPNGSFDDSFGSNGLTTVSFGLGGSHQVSGAALQSGKIVIAGFAAAGTTETVAVARLWVALVFADSFESSGVGQWSSATGVP